MIDGVHHVSAHPDGVQRDVRRPQCQLPRGARQGQPGDDLGAWVTLAQRVQKGRVRSLPFVEGVISTVRPDFDKIHALVQQALQTPSSTSSATKKPKKTTGGSGSATTATSGKAVDVKEACG